MSTLKWASALEAFRSMPGDDLVSYTHFCTQSNTRENYKVSTYEVLGGRLLPAPGGKTNFPACGLRIFNLAPGILSLDFWALAVLIL